MNFGRIIRLARIGAGLSQFELATQCRVAQGTISKIEHDTLKITAIDLFRVATVLGIDLNILNNLRIKEQNCKLKKK